MMGSPAGKGEKRENPEHEVEIVRPFAVAKYELTFNEWDACVAAGACNSQLSAGDFGRGRQPVINATWEDAQHFVKWLGYSTKYNSWVDADTLTDM